MLCHLSAFAGAVFPVFGNILGPLVVWLLRRKDSPFIDFHGRQSVNFQISLTIYLIVSAVLIVVKSGLLLLPAAFVFGVTMVIIAAVRANEGIEYRYPLAIPFTEGDTYSNKTPNALADPGRGRQPSQTGVSRPRASTG